MKQLEFVEFPLPFDGQLSTDKKSVKLAELIPREQFEDCYRKDFLIVTLANRHFGSENKGEFICLEAKSSLSTEADMERGIFQCVKYKAEMNASLVSMGI